MKCCVEAMIFLTTMISAGVQAQSNALAALKRIWQAYHPKQQIMFQSTIRIFPKSSEKDPEETIVGRFVLEPGKYYCAIGMIEMLQNGRYFVSVDNSSRVLVAGRNSNIGVNLQSIFFTPEKFISLLRAGKYRATLRASGGTAQLMLLPVSVNENPPISLEFDSSSGFLSRVRIENVSGIKAIDILYTKPVNTKNKGSLFSQERYFTIRNGRVTLSAKYKNYQLISHL